MENTLRTPWTVEPVDRWPTLFTVYDCDGNVVAAAKSEEVARLIAAAPYTKELLDLQHTLATAGIVQADPDLARPEGDPTDTEDDLETEPNRRGYHVYVGKVDRPDEGAIEDDLLSAEEEEDDNPDENFLGHGPGLESMEPYQEAPDFGWGE